MIEARDENANQSNHIPESGEGIILFSQQYGYVQVSKSEFEDSNKNMVSLHMPGLKGSVDKRNLRSSITIKLKTIYGARKIYNFEVKIDDKINVLLEKLFKAEEELTTEKKWQSKSQFRLIYSIGQVRELSPDKRFKDEKLKDSQMVILASPKPLHFSQKMHGSGILIESNDSLAFKQSGDELQFAVSDKGFSSGKSYLEFTLEAEPDENNLIFGVTLSRSDFNFNDTKDFWGFIPAECKKISPNNKLEDYGDICKMGDRIGILIDFTERGMNLTCFINKLDLGVAFKNLPAATYYPCALIKYEGSKVRLTNNVPLPEKIRD